MDGYWNNQRATAEALAGGWMHTGDLGYRSTDGYLFITDRLQDMVVTGGENVYPREIEEFRRSLPGRSGPSPPLSTRSRASLRSRRRSRR